MRVAIVAAGASSEAEVSRASARGVAAALRDAGHEPSTLELDRALAAALVEGAFDVVFPVAHGAFGEDGCLQGMLEILEVPYVGSGVRASAIAMSKPDAKLVFERAGLPIARGIELAEQDAMQAARRAREAVGSALVVKPAASGSALGVTRLEPHDDDARVASALREVWAQGSVALVESLARGRELTCSVLDVDGGPHALAATEIVAPKDAFYNYSAKYAPGRSVHTCPAPIDAGATARVHDLAVRAHVALGCRDLSRADFILSDDGALTLLEVNTLPGFTATSLFPEAAQAVGLSFAELCDRLVRHAHARGATPRRAGVPLPT